MKKLVPSSFNSYLKEFPENVGTYKKSVHESAMDILNGVKTPLQQMQIRIEHHERWGNLLAHPVTKLTALPWFQEIEIKFTDIEGGEHDLIEAVCFDQSGKCDVVEIEIVRVGETVYRKS
jgi:hypothetical protein